MLNEMKSNTSYPKPLWYHPFAIPTHHCQQVRLPLGEIDGEKICTSRHIGSPITHESFFLGMLFLGDDVGLHFIQPNLPRLAIS